MIAPRWDEYGAGGDRRLNQRILLVRGLGRLRQLNDLPQASALAI
jgi:hypothetical protein